VFLDAEHARLQAAKAVVVQRCALRRAAMALSLAQTRIRLCGTADGVKLGIAAAEVVVRALTGGKKRGS